MAEVELVSSAGPKFMVEKPVEDLMRQHLQQQGSASLQVALEKTKRSFLRGARPVVGKIFGGALLTQKFIWSAVMLLFARRGSFTGKERVPNWLEEPAAAFGDQLPVTPGFDVVKNWLKELWDRYSGSHPPEELLREQEGFGEEGTRGRGGDKKAQT